jgi:methionine sulfoxide reductase catalytic subunit
MTYYDFQIWIRFVHFINLIFITLLIRSGIEILSALPKLYWHDHAIPDIFVLVSLHVLKINRS